MNQMIIEATVQKPLGDRTVDAPLHKIDFNSFLEQIKKDKSWKKNDRANITVFKTTGMRIVLNALRKNAEMNKQKKVSKISVQVLEGKMEFTAGEQTVKMLRGQMLILNEGVEYSMLAKKKTFFLLTFTTQIPENNNA